MKTLGQRLQKARGEKGLTLVQAEKALKIRQEYLSALEADDFQKLPSLTVAKGFIKNYGQYLGLSPDSLLAIFRRDFVVQNNLPPKSKLAFFSGWRWTPKTTLIGLVLLVFLGLSVYLGYQYFSLNKKPSLTVFSPQEGQTISQAQVLVTGQADVDAAVSVNGRTVFLNNQGEWQTSVELFPGENKIVVEAVSRLGKKNKLELTVFRADTER